MIEAFLWGALGASALVVGAVLAYAAKPSVKVIAVTMALGTGLLIGSVSFELVDDAIDHADVASVGLFTLVGALVFTAGNWWIQRRGGADRKDSAGAQASGSPLAIVLGSVLDGIPESFVLGASLVGGTGVTVSFLAAVFASNLPEGVAGARDLRDEGHDPRWILGLWIAVMLISGLAAAIGFALLGAMPGEAGAFVQAFAAGAILAMLADTMIPEAFHGGGPLVGLTTVLGFAAAFFLSAVPD
jgi:ZIP family zinc transporter